MRNPALAMKQSIDWKRADPDELAAFDPSTKACAMNCGPCVGDPRSEKERRFLCDDCIPMVAANA